MTIKTPKNHDFVEPHYLKILVARLGTCVAAAKMMGVTGNVVSGALRHNSTRRVNELASKAALLELPAELPLETRDTRAIMADIRSLIDEAKRSGVGNFTITSDGMISAAVSRVIEESV